MLVSAPLLIISRPIRHFSKLSFNPRMELPFLV